MRREVVFKSGDGPGSAEEAIQRMMGQLGVDFNTLIHESICAMDLICELKRECPTGVFKFQRPNGKFETLEFLASRSESLRVAE